MIDRFDQGVNETADPSDLKDGEVQQASGVVLKPGDKRAHMVNGNSPFGTTPADVRIYTADAPDSITVISGIVSPQPLRGVTIALTGLNFIVGQGVWVNAKTDDNAVLVTVAFYYIPIEETR